MESVEATLVKITAVTMEETDWMDAIDSVQYISASDQLFGPAAIVLILGLFVAWFLNTDF